METQDSLFLNALTEFGDEYSEKEEATIGDEIAENAENLFTEE